MKFAEFRNHWLPTVDFSVFLQGQIFHRKALVTNLRINILRLCIYSLFYASCDTLPLNSQFTFQMYFVHFSHCNVVRYLISILPNYRQKTSIVPTYSIYLHTICRYGILLNLTFPCSFLRKIQKTSKIPSKLPQLTVPVPTVLLHVARYRNLPT